MEDTFSQYSRIVEAYGRYRPGYPRELVEWLNAECGFSPARVVADVGAGTGQMAEPFLKNGNQVYGIEPNADMRAAAEDRLRAYPLFTSVGATAEATALPAHSVHLIVVGNAFHWFRLEPTREEFARILIPHGWAVLVWNLERNNGSPFAMDFERFWQRHIDPAARFVRPGERRSPAYLTQFFGAENLRQKSLDNHQVCDFEALKGLALSFLKAPQAGDPRHAAMLDELKRIFDGHQERGTVRLEYDTAIAYGQLDE